MTKKKMVFTVFGAIFGIGVLVLGWLLWDKISLADENAMALSDEEAKYEGFASSKVFACPYSLATIETNKMSYLQWKDEVMKYVSRADMKPSTESPAAFKQSLTEGIAKMRKLPGGVDGRISVQTFNFGFDQFFGETARMPDQKEVPLLAKEFNVISHIVDIFADAGIVEVRTIARKNVVKVAQEESEQSNSRSRRKKNVKKSEAPSGPVATPLTFTMEILTRPAAFVNVLNDLAVDEKFIVVKKIAFKETEDTIINKINERDTASASKDQGSRGGRRRRGLAAAFEANTENKENTENTMSRLVVDPEHDAPIFVTLDIVVTDFGYAALPAEEAKTETIEKEAK
jgi:hypothetical protein